ncbi:MAG TPA: lipase maturation factor family protein [Vicinamibacterales bacterium]
MSYWYSRFLFERALAALYLVGFAVAANQFVPLLGQRGLLPVSRFTQFVPFRSSPSLFFLSPTDTAFRVCAWLGIGLAVLALTGWPQQRGTMVSGIVWALMWVLYLSFVNVGQTFYSFGWETLLLESGFLAIFLGGWATTPSLWLVWMYRWLLFRIMFGAGLIKIRGDSCWRDLTCLNYYFETQPIPNPLSWYFHWLPEGAHKAGVAINHVVELIVPFAYFAPQPVSSIAALVTVGFQGVLIVSGNLSWLNWLTLALCIPALDDRFLSWLPLSPPALQEPELIHRGAIYVLAAVVAALSVAPTLNMLSASQVMNTSFEPFHLVNTYGAFGTITRTRYEIVIEGTDESSVTPNTVWREYEFKGKPGDPSRRAPQIAPYHLRLDWLMWFEAFSPQPQDEWFIALLRQLLRGDAATVALLKTNPFPGGAPRFLRARYYRYWFTTADQRRQTGRWWSRQLVSEYVPPITLSAFTRP